MLSDKEYSNLKSDEWIAGCIVMLEDIMSVSKEKRSEHSKDRKKSDIDSIVENFNKAPIPFIKPFPRLIAR